MDSGYKKELTWLFDIRTFAVKSRVFEVAMLLGQCFDLFLEKHSLLVLVSQKVRHRFDLLLGEINK